MGQVHEFLGLTVGVILNSDKNDARRAAYNCDITYVTNNELGFDYLRDNMVIYKEQLVQRDLHYAIVDEVDSVLIDEARYPIDYFRTERKVYRSVQDVRLSGAPYEAWYCFDGNQ